MADEFQRLWETVTRDPGHMAFLPLGEHLRRRGELESAARVAVNGLEKHPALAAGHDLYARILTDMGDFEAAEEEWQQALDAEPRHTGANKGMGFVRFREGHLDEALEYLETALASVPSDQAIVRALHAVRAAIIDATAEAEEQGPIAISGATAKDTVFAGLEGSDGGMLLVDQRGRILGGRLHAPGGGDISETVAAYLAGATQEAERTARMLELGEWEWIVSEGPEGNIYVTPPTDETLLFILRDRTVPAGRLALLSERAGAAARQWLVRQRL